MVKRILRWTDVVACVMLVALAIRFGPRTSVWYAGLLVTAVSFPLWVIARQQLGIAFSARPVARHLVTRGLYSKIRHPIYIFGTLAFLFVVLALQGWPALIIWVIVILIQVVR